MLSKTQSVSHWFEIASYFYQHNEYNYVYLRYSNDRFKPGTFFVSSIILRAKHELTSKAASKSVVLDCLLDVKNNKALDAVS